nr:MarR family transcriptional regulator [Solirubrobacterales bacterium]
MQASSTDPVTGSERALAARVEQVRAFNRFYLPVVGVLRQGLLSTPYSPPEARVIFELGRRERRPAAELRQALRIDAGYLSRLIARLEQQGLLSRERSQSDARRQVLGLTAAGRRAYETLNRRSADQVRAALEALSEVDQRRLVSSMAAIERLLGGHDEDAGVLLRPPASGDWGWILERHGAVFGGEYGWDEDFERLIAGIIAEYLPQRAAAGNAGWIAELDGERVGSIFCVAGDEPGVARLRLLLVDADARGRGVGSRLVAECARFARRAGYSQLVLWTFDALTHARPIYEAAGFNLSRETSGTWFGHEMTGQDWTLEL